jgi:hypothetical protein
MPTTSRAIGTSSGSSTPDGEAAAHDAPRRANALPCRERSFRSLGVNAQLAHPGSSNAAGNHSSTTCQLSSSRTRSHGAAVPAIGALSPLEQ